MYALLQIAGFFAVSAAVAFLFTLVWVAWKKAKQLSCLTVGTPARMKTKDGVYRTRFSRATKEGLHFTGPIQRDHFQPIRVGERVTLEVPMSSGVAIFRSEVVGRIVASHEIVVRSPQRLHCQERRDAVRKDARTKEIRVEDQAAWLCDLAPHGIKLVRDGVLRQGERIKVEMPCLEEPVYAWVLECTKNFDRMMGTHIVRARFEEPVQVSGC